MAKDAYADLLDFYRKRGYRFRVGMGERPALIVIDFSYGFTASSDDFPGGEFGAELKATRRLLDAMRGRFPVYLTTIAYGDPAREGGLWAKKVPWLLRFERGAQSVRIDRRLGEHADDALIEKPAPSSFHGTKLDALLRERNIDTVIIAGCTTSVCVRATALDAMQHGYRAIVAREAVGDFNPQVHEVHLQDLDARYADVTPVDEILAHLAALPR
jgi:nicotinamidase-related amidase